MRAFFISLVLALLFATEPVFSFPQVVAGFILGRPVTESSVEKQLGSMNAFTDPFIEGTDAISVLKIPVGNPEVELSVLVVEPRRYGLRVEEKIEFQKNKNLDYTLSIGLDDGTASEAARKILSEITGLAEGEVAEVTPTPEQMSQLLREQARVGGGIPSTDHPRTIFLLLGYGVPKKVGWPMALLLANHGIRTVIPDLRGQGESGGKGVTWGKNEPGDLADLLTALQSKGIVGEESVAVLGVSYGAVMAALWASQDPRVETAVLAAPYQRADTKIITASHSFMGDIKLPFTLKKETLIKGTELAAKRLDMSWEDVSAIEAVPKIPNPVLFLASSGDELIPQEEVKELYETAQEGSKLHVYEKLPHLLLGLNFTGIESVVVEWLKETGFLEP